MAERRGRPRIPFVEIAAYRVLDTVVIPEAGIGQTVTLSCEGVLLRTQRSLRVGLRIELNVGHLIARGRVTQFQSGCAAILFDRASGVERC